MIDWTKLLIEKFDDLSSQLPNGRLEIEEGDKPNMADTFGSLIDKLAIVNLKMWYNQEKLYEIRRMNEDEFVSKYKDGMAELHKIIKICCDMNVLRNQLIDEINERLSKMVETLGGTRKNIEALRLIAPSHKSY